MMFAVDKLNNPQRIRVHHQWDELASLARRKPKQRDLAFAMSTSSEETP